MNPQEQEEKRTRRRRTRSVAAEPKGQAQVETEQTTAASAEQTLPATQPLALDGEVQVAPIRPEPAVPEAAIEEPVVTPAKEAILESTEVPNAEAGSAAPPGGASEVQATEVAEAPLPHLAAGQAPPEEVADGRAWYVVHSYSGYENKVKKNLEHRIESMNMQHRIFQVTVPTEEEIEIRDGHRRRTKRRVFPGYILVQMIMDDDSWYVVRNTPGVTGFVSSGTKPSPLRPEEVDKIFTRMEMEAPKIKVGFREGQTVRIVDGPFADFVGTVDDMNLEKGRVRVLVSFFGRETPVELDFLQVQKQ